MRKTGLLIPCSLLAPGFMQTLDAKCVTQRQLR